MRRQFQSHIIAFIGTLIVLCLILLLLWFLRVKAPVQPEDEGIVVVFGNAEEGGGMSDVSDLDEVTQIEQIPAPAEDALPTDNELLVQDDEESLELAKQAAEEAKRKAEQEELLRKRQAEQARLEAERIAQEKALAEKKAKEQEAIDKANALMANFGQAGADEGANAKEDSNTGMGADGHTEGAATVGPDDVIAKINGRKVVSLMKPNNTFTQEGTVRVQIWVDVKGNVTNAKVVEGVVDRSTQQLAIQAALKSKFTEGDTPQIGEITYIFKFK